MLTAAAGALLREVARRTVAENWQGLEWAVGVPGTIGGAVVGNAGAYGGSMSDTVRWVRLLRPDGIVERAPADVLAYGLSPECSQAGAPRTGRAPLCWRRGCN